MALSASEIFFSTTELLGGIGLFLYGMELMSRELQKMAGHRMRMFLSRLTNNRWSGLGLGTLLGFLIHSGPTTVMTVGFTNAGLIPLTSAGLVRQIANTHTAVQALTAMIFIPFTRQYAEFITRIFPSQQIEPEKSHLEDSLLEMPEFDLNPAGDFHTMQLRATKLSDF